MAFRDKLTTLCDAQALTAGTTVFTDVIDLTLVAGRQVGDGEPMCMVVTVDVAAAGSTDTTQLQVRTDDAAALTSPTILASRTIPNALLVAGSQWVLPVPPGSPYLQYLGGAIVLGSGDSITLSAAIVPQSMVDMRKDYAKGYVNT